MKKRTKIILASILGGIVTLGSVAGIGIAIDCSIGNVSGTTYEPENEIDVQEGTDKYDWRKNEANISYGITESNQCEEKFYSNGLNTFGSCNDYITNIYFVETTSYTSICFDCKFDVSSGMEVFFVFDNGYTTNKVKTNSMTSFLGCSVEIDSADLNEMKSQGKDLAKAKIVEVWAKTILMVSEQNLVEGTGTYDWKKYDVNIKYGIKCTERFYTNEGDFITDIVFAQERYSYGDDYMQIEYGNWFNIFDDFEVVFVFSNMKEGSEELRYATDVQLTHLLGEDRFEIPCSYLDPNWDNTTIKEFCIVELWIRTVD